MQVSTAEKQSHAMKHQQVPLACYPDQLSWFAQLRNYFSNEDPCAEYFKTTLIDSAIKISPLQAISDVLVGMVFEPSGYIGQQVGKFFYSLLSKFAISSLFIGIYNEFYWKTLFQSHKIDCF